MLASIDGILLNLGAWMEPLKSITSITEDCSSFKSTSTFLLAIFNELKKASIPSCPPFLRLEAPLLCYKFFFTLLCTVEKRESVARNHKLLFLKEEATVICRKLWLLFRYCDLQSARTLGRLIHHCKIHDLIETRLIYEFLTQK